MSEVKLPEELDDHLSRPNEEEGPQEMVVDIATEEKEQPARPHGKPRDFRKLQRALYSAHVGANVAASFFKALSFAMLVGGAVAAIDYERWLSDNTTLGVAQIGGIVIGILVATVILASACAFFGYALSLLVQIEGNTRETALNVRTGDVPRSRTR